MTRLYLADVSGLDIGSALERVTPYRREKALRCRLDDDKRRSLGVALLLQRVFGDGFSYDVGADGKPLADSTHFSLSHSGRFAVCAVGEAELGVDVEFPRKNSLRLAKRFLSEAECEKLTRSDDPDEDICALWVVREACVKCSGAGLSALCETDVSDYFTAHLMFEDCHIGLASKADLGEIEIHIEHI